jgi:hypothetical protein
MTFPGPTPPYTNPPITPWYYQPSQFFITDIVNGQLTTITTSINHNYVVGQQVRILVPSLCQMYEISNQTAIVVSIPNPNEVVVNVDSSLFNSFVSNPTGLTTRPQIMAIGDQNTAILNPNGRTQDLAIDGSFINISPL